jgi:hypothetical protein
MPRRRIGSPPTPEALRQLKEHFEPAKVGDHQPTAVEEKPKRKWAGRRPSWRRPEEKGD